MLSSLIKLVGTCPRWTPGFLAYFKTQQNVASLKHNLVRNCKNKNKKN